MSPASKEDIRLRFPPSPTGPLTLGNVRSGLFNWLLARQKGGTFILRIEDTDPERSKEEFEYVITESLKWLGLEWDEGIDWNQEKGQWTGSQKGDYGPYRQTERTDIYRKYLEQLLAEDKAYYCYCSKEELEAQRQALEAQGLAPKYTGKCRNLTEPPAGKEKESGVIRLKVPEAIVEFKDIIRSTISFDAALLGDFIIARSIDSALYHFAVVVDDALMKVSHVIRGEDHISNTPKHILLQKALGFPEVKYGHLPLVLGPDRKKLSKRTADISILECRDKGYLPEAIVNFLALLGWHPEDDQEIFTVAEIIEKFDIRRVQKGGAIFNPEKLEWINAQHMKRLSDQELIEKLQPFLEKAEMSIEAGLFERIVRTQRDRLKTLNDFIAQNDFFFALPEYDANLLVWKTDDREKTNEVIAQATSTLEKIPEDSFSKQEIFQILDPLLAVHGRGSVLWPVRVALSGKSTSPDPTEIAEVLGKEETLRRLSYAEAKLGRVIV